MAEFLRLCRSMSNPVRLELALRDATTRFGMNPDQLRSEMEKIPAEYKLRFPVRALCARTGVLSNGPGLQR